MYVDFIESRPAANEILEDEEVKEFWEVRLVFLESTTTKLLHPNRGICGETCLIVPITLLATISFTEHFFVFYHRNSRKTWATNTLSVTTSRNPLKDYKTINVLFG